MSQPLSVPLPPDVDLWGGCKIRVTALNPTTGNTVSGVDVSDVTLQVVLVAGDRSDLEVGRWRLVPGPGA